MFAVLEWKTLIVFASSNFASLPLVYFFFPETNGRILEEINLLYAAHSPIVSANQSSSAGCLMRLVERGRGRTSARGGIGCASGRVRDEG